MTEDNKGRGGDGVETESGTCADIKKDKQAERGSRNFFFLKKKEKRVKPKLRMETEGSRTGHFFLFILND